METSPCIRCGKPRIVAKTWKENIGGSVITYTETVCPDPECQKLVDAQLKSKKDRLEKIQSESLKRRSHIRRGKKKAAKK